MKKRILIGLFFCLTLALGARYIAVGEDYGASNFSADGRKLQPVPEGHTPGKDNGPGTGTHNAGEDCGICHRPGGKASGHIFTMAGTLYEDRAATRVVKGGEVIIQDIDGKVISMTSNEAGNFWTYTPIGSNPRAVANHGGPTELLFSHDDNGKLVPADPTDSRSWQYKAWVRSGERFTRMVTIAPVGGATDPASRMSCNMHHAALGSRGGLWLPAKSTLPSYPTSDLSFKRYILPILRNKCAPCHIPGSTFTRPATESDTLTPSTSIDYSHGLDFTSYAGSTVDGASKKGAQDFALSYQSSPDSSPMLSMPASPNMHPGGKIWTTADPDYKAIRQWIAEGSQNN
jgi:hypothetical protein